MNTKGHRKIQKPLKRQVQVHLQSSSSSHVNVRGSLWASRRRPLGSRRATLCHCATVAAAVSNFLLMGIGFAVSLLADDGPNSAALFPSSLRNKSAPRLSPLWPFWCRTPWLCESAHKWPAEGQEGGEVMAATRGNTCSSQMSRRRCTVPGAIQGHV